MVGSLIQSGIGVQGYTYMRLFEKSICQAISKKIMRDILVDD